MNSELLTRLELLGKHLKNVGWGDDELGIRIFDTDEDPQSGFVLRAQMFILKINAIIKERVCEDGSVRPEARNISELAGICAFAIEQISEVSVDVTLVADVLTSMGLEVYCSG
jgi:hypothetical protein